MKFINYIKYIPDLEKVAALRPTHREYMSQLSAQGKVVAAGPFTDGTGALMVYEVASREEIEAIVAQDPYTLGGAFASHEITAWNVVNADPGLLGSSR